MMGVCNVGVRSALICYGVQRVNRHRESINTRSRKTENLIIGANEQNYLSLELVSVSHFLRSSRK